MAANSSLRPLLPSFFASFAFTSINMSQSEQKRRQSDFAASLDKKFMYLDRPHFSGFLAYSNISPLDSGFEKLWVRMPDSPYTCEQKANPQRKSY